MQTTTLRPITSIAFELQRACAVEDRAISDLSAARLRLQQGVCQLATLLEIVALETGLELAEGAVERAEADLLNAASSGEYFPA